MTKIEVLQEEIEKLDPDEWAKLRAWFIERDWDEWDREIEEDSASGALDELVKAAREAHRRGESTQF